MQPWSHQWTGEHRLPGLAARAAFHCWLGELLELVSGLTAGSSKYVSQVQLALTRTCLWLVAPATGPQLS